MCLTPCNSMDCSTPTFSVLHYLLEFAQIYGHLAGGAIQPSHSRSPLLFCLPSFPASGSFPVNPLFVSGGQSTGTSTLASVFPRNIQGWFPLGLTGLISLLSKGLSRVSPAPQFKSTDSLALSLLYSSTFTSVHDYWKNHSFDHMDLVGVTTLLTQLTLKPPYEVGIISSVS